METIGTKTGQKEYREFTVDAIRSIEGKDDGRRFRISFSSEQPYDRCWGREILEHADNSVDLTRINEIGCVLFNHDRNKVIGKIERAWIENGRGEAEISIDEDEESEKIYQKMKSGTLKGVSVGYIVDVWEEVLAGKKSSDGRFEGPVSIAKKWVPFEISVVSVPADPTVGVSRQETSPQRSKGVGQGFFDYERQLIVNKNRSF